MSEAVERPGVAVDPMRLLVQLKRWRWAFIGGAILGVTAGIAIALLTKPHVYQSAAVLEWTGSAKDAAALQRKLNTLVDGVKLAPNIARIRQELEIPATLEQIASRIDARVAHGSNVISIKGSAGDADEARRFVDSVVKVFLANRREVESDIAKKELRSLQKQVAAARAHFALSRVEYDNFRRKHGFIDAQAEQQAGIQEAAALRSAAQRARADAASERARARELRRLSKRLPATILLKESELRPGLKKLGELKAELTAARAGLSPKHPRVLALEAQVAAFSAELKAEKTVVKQRTYGRNTALDQLQQVLTASAAQRRASSTKSAVFSSSMAQIERRLGKLSKLDGAARELILKMQTAATHLAERETDLRRQRDLVRSPKSHLRVVAEPTRPVYPSKSYRKVIAAAIPAGVMLLMVFAWLVWVLWGLRVHSAKEVAFWGRAPVVASTTWPREPEAMATLFEELHEPLSQAALDAYISGGEQGLFSPKWPTLLVPAGPEEIPLAREIASLFATRDDSDRDGASTRDDYALRVWDGATTGAELRLVAKKAERILVLVSAGQHSALSIAATQGRLGRRDRLAYILCNVSEHLAHLPAEVGDISRFWEGQKPLRVG